MLLTFCACSNAGFIFRHMKGFVKKAGGKWWNSFLYIKRKARRMVSGGRERAICLNQTLKFTDLSPWSFVPNT